MQVAVISDIHENYHNLLKAIETMPDHGVERVVCLGDLINAGVAHVLAGCGLPVYYLVGNNDGDIASIIAVAAGSGGALQTNGRTYAFLKIAGRRIFATHFPDLAEPMARSQQFDAVFYGHDHRKRVTRIGPCLVVNPGELSGHKTGDVTYAVYDTEKNDVELVTVPDAISLRSNYVRDHPAWQQAHIVQPLDSTWSQQSDR